MITETQKAEYMQKIRAAISDLGTDPDLITLVKGIESGIKTTKYNYGRYMAAISQFCPQGSANRPTMIYITGRAMINAGADPDGVQWASKLLQGK